jgi:hypothetical protein
VHIDSSLIRANVSWDSLVERHVADVLSENQTEEKTEVERKGRQSGKYRKVCTTDPDATMATNARNRRLEPAYKAAYARGGRIPGWAIGAQPRCRQAPAHRRDRLVCQEISERRAAEGPADERCHHRLSQPRVPRSPKQKCERLWTLP